MAGILSVSAQEQKKAEHLTVETFKVKVFNYEKKS
jgi:hypothetical protein